MFEIVHWDTETHTIAPGRPAPPPVCLQWLGVPVGASAPYSGGGVPPEELAQLDGPHVLHGPSMGEFFWWLTGLDSTLACSLNQSYDVLVMAEELVRRGASRREAWTRIFGWLERGLQRCTAVRQRLLRIARGLPDMGGLSMEEQALEYLGLDMSADKGAEGWRLRFGELERWPLVCEAGAFLAHVADLRARGLLSATYVPIPVTEPSLGLALAEGERGTWGEGERVVLCEPDVVTPSQAAALLRGEVEPGSPRDPRTWPPAAYGYAAADPLVDRGIYRGQAAEAIVTFGRPEIPDEVARPIAALELHMSASRGLRTDGARARRAGDSLERTVARLREVLITEGLMRRKVIHAGKPQQRVEVSKDTKALHRRIEATLTAAGVDVPRTAPSSKHPNGQVATDKEVLQLAELASDPGLRALVAYNACEKLHETYVRPLTVECGAANDGWCGLDRPMLWRYQVLKNTGRTSASKTRYSVLRDGRVAEERDGNNVQNYSTGDTMLAKARDVLSVIGYGEPGDGEYDDDFARAVADAVADGARSPAEVDEYKLPAEDFRARREILWAGRHDVRSLVIARDGFLLVNRDYSGIEMVTLAQCQVVHYGQQVTLAQVLNDTTVREYDVLGKRVAVEGTDPHLYVGVFAHEVLWGERLTYEELVFTRLIADAKKKRGEPLTPRERRVLETRKLCKVINFGFLGGMGARTFVQYVWQRVRVRLTVEQAQALKRAWYLAFPEMPDWFSFIGQEVDQDAPVVQLGSGRVRGGCTFTQNANTRFQGLAADGALNALHKIWRACLTEPDSPLYGARPLVFEHDAFLVEVPNPANDAYRVGANGPEGYAVRADEELGRLMVAGMRELVPDVIVRTEGTPPSRRWGK